MAVVLIEGFDFWDSTMYGARGWFSANATDWNGLESGRFGGYSERLYNPGGHATVWKPLPSAYTTAIFGFALQPNTSRSWPLARLRTAAGATVATLLINPTGLTIQNSGGTTIASASVTIANLAWRYYELKIVVNGASGSCSLQLDGVPLISPTTGNFGSTAIGQILFDVDFDSRHNWDDIYVVDGTGAAPNDFLGDCRVQTIRPTGDGSHTQWSPFGAANNWDCVNDTTPDSDTTYVYDLTAGHYDTYACADVTAQAVVYGVQVNLYAKKDDAGVRQIAPAIRQGGVDYDGSTVTLSTSYAYYSQLYAADPTGAAWTAANVNADEYGVKVIA